jgi:hypothetical protein
VSVSFNSNKGCSQTVVVVDVAVTTEVVEVEEAQHRQLQLGVTAVTDVIAAHAVISGRIAHCF